MKIKELVEKLKNADPNANIYILTPYFKEDYNEYKEIEKIKIDKDLDFIIMAENCFK